MTSYSQKQHNWKVLLRERSLRKFMRKTIPDILVNNNNEQYLSYEILSYLFGPCDKCHNTVSSTITIQKGTYKNKNVCFTCFDKMNKKNNN